MPHRVTKKDQIKRQHLKKKKREKKKKDFLRLQSGMLWETDHILDK